MVLVTKPVKLLDNIVMQYGKINFLIPDLVIEELKNLVTNSSYKSSVSAKTVLKITKKFEILDYAINYKCAVATMDKNLIQRLISSKVLVFSLRNNKLLIMNS
jgi:rRNA-processing protein FCF1